MEVTVNKNKNKGHIHRGLSWMRLASFVAYPSTMSSPYFTGTLVEAVVEMFSCSGEYIGLD